MLRILLLGTSEVSLDGQTVRIQRRIQRALLFYLACQPDPVGRSDLMLLFWPDASEKDARRHLREALSKLRAQLDDDSYWVIDLDRLGLNHKNIYVDVMDFRNSFGQYWQAIQQIPQRVPLPEALHAELVRATALWRSPRFLPGITLPSTEQFDRWLASATQDLEWSHQHLLERLGYHFAAAGDLDSAIQWMRRALEHDELNESMNIQVITWLRDQGHRTDALNALSNLNELFLQETEAELPPALMQLWERIRSEVSAQPSHARANWPASLSLQVPFVGRAQHLQQLTSAYQRGGSVAVFGEAGAGKTRLAHQFYLTLVPEPRLLLAQARQTENSLPFQPLVEMLRQNVRMDEWKQLNKVWLEALAGLLPELYSLIPVQPQNHGDLNEARAHVFEALRQLLLKLSISDRLLFFLDDAQWCDEATLAALAYLQERRFFDEHGLLVLAARIEEKNHYLEEFMHRPHIQSMLVRFNLSRLNRKEVLEMTRSIIRQEPSSQVAERLAQDTGGNPLFLIETLRAWLDQSPRPDLTQAIDSLPTAGSIHTLLLERIHKSTIRRREVLSAAAVIGHEFPLDLLEAVTGLAPEQLVQDLEELEQSHLIVPDHRFTPALGYAFIHDRFREVLLEDLSPARRRLLHLRVAKALEAAFRGEIGQGAALLAGHYESAGQTQEAYSYWLQAARYARRLYARADAYANFRRAETIYQAERQKMSDEEVYRLYAAWGETAYDLADIRTMQSVYSALLRCGEFRHSQRLVGAAWSGLANVSFLREENEQALDQINTAIPYLERGGDDFERMQAYLRKGSALVSSNRYGEANQAFHQIIDLGHNTAHPRAQHMLVNAEEWLAYIDTMTGWPVQAQELAEHALSERRLLLEPIIRFRAHLSLGMALFYRGKIQQSLEICQEGLRLAEAIDNWRYQILFLGILARCEIAFGFLDDCWIHLNQAIELSTRHNYHTGLANALSVRGELLRVTFHLSESIRLFRQVVEETEESYTLMQTVYRLGLALVLSGEREEGREMLQRAIQYGARVGAGMVQIPAEMDHAFLQALEGDPQGVTRLCELIEEATTRELGMLPQAARLGLARIYLSKGQVEEALAQVEKVLEVSREIPGVFIEISALGLATGILRRQGKPADDLTARLCALIDRIGQHAHLPDVRPLFDKFREQTLLHLNLSK